MGGRTLRDELRELSNGWRWGRRMVVPRSAEPFAPPKEPKPYPTDWARTKAGRVAREALLQWVMRPIAWNETSPEIFGLDHLDAIEPPAMFVSNHSSHLDATLIMITLPRSWRHKTAVAAAKDYFFDVWWRSVFTTLVYAGVPIERGAGERATQKVRELVADGWSIVVFPEGTRSTDGWVRRFQHGTARLAIELQIPVVPIAIVGAYQSMPKGRNWPVKGRPPIRMRYGAPLQPIGGETHQQLSLRMQQAIARLFDEDRTTWWEALRRAEAGTTPSLHGPATAPRWLRTWEGSRAVPRRGPRRAWR